MTQETGLHLVFEERRERNGDAVQCGVKVTEICEAGTFTEYVELNEFYHAQSWEAFKREYPCLEDILEMCTGSVYWRINSESQERTLFIESIKGYEGLYTYSGDVRFECYV